jgi:hypothetical protein
VRMRVHMRGWAGGIRGVYVSMHVQLHRSEI